MPDAPANPTIDPALLEILRCPVTRSPLQLVGNELVAQIGGLRYPIRDGIPVMLPEEARLPEGYASLDDFKAKLAAGAVGAGGVPGR